MPIVCLPGFYISLRYKGSKYLTITIPETEFQVSSQSPSGIILTTCEENALHKY